MTVFRTATLGIFFFAIHAGAKELNNAFKSFRGPHQMSLQMVYFAPLL